jgi:hypothetical protein
LVSRPTPGPDAVGVVLEGGTSTTAGLVLLVAPSTPVTLVVVGWERLLLVVGSAWHAVGS